MHCRGVCVTGCMHGVGYVWQADMHCRGTCMAGVGGGVGACVLGETATAADCTHTTGMHSCIN